MEYKELKSGITEHLNSAAEDFFMVGYFLRQISDKALFIEDGYKSIWEFAKGEYNLSTSSASRFMAINARFSVDGGEHMAEKYIGMGVSKLQEMLCLPDEELEKVTKETTVKEIRAMKAAVKEPLSFFELPKTVRSEGSLLTTPGCGDGKYNCFSCSRPCGIRQEPRQCVVSNLGNPKPCGLINNEEWQGRMGYSVYKGRCQMLHHELAPFREGDKEPDPCCRNCENKICFNRCDVAKEEDKEEEKKIQQAELRKQHQEAEAKKSEPSDADIKAFYDWERIKATDNVTAEALKNKLRNAGGGGGGFDYKGSACGIRINYKREITWSQLAKRLKEIQEKEKKKPLSKTCHNRCDVANAEDKEEEKKIQQVELGNQQQGAEAKKPEPSDADIKAFYDWKRIKSTDNITAGAFKEELRYAGVHSIDFDFQGSARGIRINCKQEITWSQLAKRLKEIQEKEKKEKKEPLSQTCYNRCDVAKVEGEVVEEDENELLCDGCANASSLTGNVDLCANCGPTGSNYKPLQDDKTEAEDPQEQEADPEQYRVYDIQRVLIKHEADLKAYREVGGMPENLMKKQRILVDALTLLLHEVERKLEEGD